MSEFTENLIQMPSFVVEDNSHDYLYEIVLTNIENNEQRINEIISELNNIY